MPFLCVYLQSIKKQSNSSTNYDVIVFERDISEEQKKRLIDFICRKNISLRFVNPESLLQRYNLKTPPHYSLECYFRLVAPIMLKNYKKVLFTDIDLVFEKDPMILYKTDLLDYPLGACKDYMWGAMLELHNERKWADYASEVLKLEKPYEYFNTGVMLLNIGAWNNKEYSTKLLDMVSKYTYRILEQDALNSFFQTNVLYLDTAWNYPIAHKKNLDLVALMPESEKTLYLKDSTSPYIVHYAGAYKPWLYPEAEKAYIWWEHARNTPFYSEILSLFIDSRSTEALSKNEAISRLRASFENKHFPDINKRFAACDHRSYLLYVMEHRWRFRLIGFQLRLLIFLASKNAKPLYRAKYNAIKKHLIDSRKLKKHWESL